MDKRTCHKSESYIMELCAEVKRLREFLTTEIRGSIGMDCMGESDGECGECSDHEICTEIARARKALDGDPR